MNMELKRIGTIALDKNVDVNKVIYNNPKLGIRLAEVKSKYENENRFAIYVDETIKSKPKKTKAKKVEIKEEDVNVEEEI